MRDVDIFNTSAKPSTFLAYHKFLNKIRLLHTLLLFPGLNLSVKEIKDMSFMDFTDNGKYWNMAII